MTAIGLVQPTPDRSDMNYISGQARDPNAPTGGGGRGAGATASHTTAYQDFVAPARVYRAFPGLRVWNGPYNLNGSPVGGWQAWTQPP